MAFTKPGNYKSTAITPAEEYRGEVCCAMGDVRFSEEWDKFNLGMYEETPPDTLAEMEVAPKELTVGITKDPERGRRLNIEIEEMEGFTAAEVKRHQSAEVLTERVLNSDEFKRRVLAKKYTTTKRTPQQIYDHIMTGEEVLRPGVDYTMNVAVTMYYKKNNVVGYTYPNVTGTWLNRYVTAGYKEDSIAGNLVHEWLHKLGYGHSSASDHNSVPYAIGYIVRDMVKELMNGGGQHWIDLYPAVTVINPTTPESPPDAKPPIVIPEQPIKTKKVCSWTWQFWKGKQCYYVRDNS